MGRTYWMKANLRRGIRTSVVRHVMTKRPESTYDKLSIVSVLVAMGGLRGKARRQDLGSVENVMSGGDRTGWGSGWGKDLVGP
jgi:hypothetical protein